VQVDALHRYGEFTVIPFEINLDSNFDDGLAVKAVKLFSRDFKTRVLKPIAASTRFPKRLREGEPAIGSVTYLSNQHNPEQLLSLQVMVGEKTVEVSW
jgi:hypothetical protein